MKKQIPFTFEKPVKIKFCDAWTVANVNCVIKYNPPLERGVQITNNNVQYSFRI